MTPIVLLTGVDPDAMATTMIGLQFDLPQAVAVRHHIDPEREILERVVSDLSGTIEHEVIPLAHACVPCALREDIVPTLERLGRDGRWASIIAHLPMGAEAKQVCNLLAWNTGLSKLLRVGSVLVAIDGERAVDDLLGDVLLRERGCHSSFDDIRGVGEVACGMVEYADVVVGVGGLDDLTGDLLEHLARPGAHVVAGVEDLDMRLISSLHVHRETDAWANPLRSEPLLPASSPSLWQADLRSPRAFHPQRLRSSLEMLGGGRHRSRGCFHLPTRPGQALVWDGSGGQLSIGRGEPWGDRPPMSRIVAIGVGAAPIDLESAFRRALLSGREARGSGRDWAVTADGFEPWLGPIRDVA